MIHLVDPHQPFRKLKHVVSQRDHDELRVLGAFFDVAGYDRHLWTDISITSMAVGNGCGRKERVREWHNRAGRCVYEEKPA